MLFRSVAPDVAALPKASFLWTVKSPLVVPAVAADGVEVMTSCDEAAGFTVNDVVAEVRPVALFVIVNVPAVLSLYLKVPDELPGLIVIDVIVLVSVESLKTPVALDDERSTVVVSDVEGLPYTSCLWTVKSPLAVPAVAADDAEIVS